ncbi:MAG: cyclodeaminase/cyclohydrolase family protein [Firmicutes bacterium]|nr:cyclodeaminase/cyclohydrolase family protein [Bacillota bacterium]
MLTKLTLKQFVTELATESPAPGGGSSAALTGAQGAALVSMYCRLSLDPAKYEAAKELGKISDRARRLAFLLVEAVDRDSESFKQVLEAYRLPRKNSEAKKLRSLAISNAYIGAARVPLQTARYCLEIMELGKQALGKGNPAAITDLGVGNLLAGAALRGACYNVQINLSSIKDEVVRSELAREMEELVQRGRSLAELNRELIEKEQKV